MRQRTRPKRSIVVHQFDNPRYNSNDRADTYNNPKYIYVIEKVVNTIEFHVDQHLTPRELEKAITEGITVTVQKPR